MRSIQNKLLFGKYRIEGVLGQGASSTVYLAEHIKLKQYRAIKSISKSDPAQQQFFLEAELLQTLHHSGIPTIYDVEEDEESYYFVEEYIRGESLEAFVLHHESISLSLIISIGIQLCDIFMYLHSQTPPIIYQDLKPEHVLLCGNQIYLIDFGIAVKKNSLEHPFRAYGTKAYAPPEKYQTGSIDQMVDIYGIGKILQFLSVNQDQSSRCLNGLIQKACAYDPKDRYPSVEQLKEALASLDGVPRKSGTEEKKEHLLKKIAVLGSQSGIGVTHVAIAFVTYLNSQGIRSYYKEGKNGQVLSGLSAGSSGVKESKGFYTYGNFKGKCHIGEGIQLKQEMEQEALEIEICDMGAYESINVELEEYDGILLVLGGRLWEVERSMQVYDKLRLHPSLAFTFNYGNVKEAKQYAVKWRRWVYCFPLDESPFLISEAKKSYFEKIMKKERW